MTKKILFILFLIIFVDCNNQKKLYINTIKSDSYKDYNFFLEKYPSGKYSDEIKQKRLEKDSIEILIGTFLGNESRNYYGDSLPDRLDTIWSFYLGEGLSSAYGYNKIWKGAGWTGQPILVNEKGRLFVVQPAFDYGLHKIDAQTGKEVWCYKFDDILKASPTIYVNRHSNNIENRYIIMQGSRKGWDKDKDSRYCWSFRAISYISGKELWRMNSLPTACYSRDVDGSAIVIDDSAYLALENGIFNVFSPDFSLGSKVDSFTVPKIFKQIQYFTYEDIKAHGDDLVAEASPTYFNNRVYTPSGTGWIYGYNIFKGSTDWQFYIGADLNGTMPLTNDNCLLVPIEKQYIKGNGGVMKIDPSKDPKDAVVWFLPTDTVNWSHWEGGVIGSITVNDKTKASSDPYIAVFVDCKGFLYVVDYMNLQDDTVVLGPDGATMFKTPVVLAKIKLISTIATPIIVKNRILVPCDGALYLYEFSYTNNQFSIQLLDMIDKMSIDATPICWNGRIYLADFNGYLWCLGKQ